MRRVLIVDETRLTDIEDEPMGGTNRSGDLNEVLTCKQQRMLAPAVLDANCEEARTDYQQEFATWERILTDAQEHEQHGHES
jgi:hypothetical protein